MHFFSFYLIKSKKHEREIETVLIRVASHLLMFNRRKKRDDIEPGDVRERHLVFRTSAEEGQAKDGATQAADKIECTRVIAIDLAFQFAPWAATPLEVIAAVAA